MNVAPSTTRARAKFVFIEILLAGFSRRWGKGAALTNNFVSRAYQALATLVGLWARSSALRLVLW
jgi:hypothetical protein